MKQNFFRVNKSGVFNVGVSFSLSSCAQYLSALTVSMALKTSWYTILLYTHQQHNNNLFGCLHRQLVTINSWMLDSSILFHVVLSSFFRSHAFPSNLLISPCYLIWVFQFFMDSSSKLCWSNCFGLVFSCARPASKAFGYICHSSLFSDNFIGNSVFQAHIQYGSLHCPLTLFHLVHTSVC